MPRQTTGFKFCFIRVFRAFQCLRYIKSLAYNPPPRTARLRGDLWYVEIGTLEGTLVDVVATENGFCVLSIRAPEQPCNAYPAST